ncbi:uncharacterized protein GGS25DRAFT_478691 [Hypoxylon fragiforme]|uniref:uncharacterized protein n=1 Tax=Hypoxylon fragiforme TaxID=63214 RepID=UPI0020C62F72|nr:uncharacterized protein GGS25DRAFT_478691 [Hypoxylon fragiforme]KAI2613140.1 hypothetical protein GGS25DRAFT_478691 [Hypoxylon fragiforme]
MPTINQGFNHHTTTGPWDPNGANHATAHTTAIDISNAAVAASRRGDYNEAARLHQQALELKLRAFPATSVQAGISYNGLGEALLRAGRFDEADAAFASALQAREAGGPRSDAAITRDNIARLREAQGRFEDAREMRLRGRERSEVMCGNYHCPTSSTMFALTALQACGGCRSVWYCSKNCQKGDWQSRHKPLCKAYTEGLAAAAATTAGEGAST